MSRRTDRHKPTKHPSGANLQTNKKRKEPTQNLCMWTCFILWFIVYIVYSFRKRIDVRLSDINPYPHFIIIDSFRLIDILWYLSSQSDESEDNYSEIRRVIESSIRQQLTGLDTSSPESSPSSGFLGMCARSGCPNPRINTEYAGPGQLSYYCCYDCLRIDMRNKKRRRKKRGIVYSCLLLLFFH